MTKSFALALLLFFAAPIVPITVLSATDDQTTPYSMTISGGISLGNYEAGMNWAIIEIFRLARENKIDANAGKLLSVTGASAGSINALVSALRYCQAEESGTSSIHDNLFYKTWIDVGFDGLLPANEADYDTDINLKNISLQDGVLSRKPFNKVIMDIKDYIENMQYTPGCTVRIGMSLTRENAIKTKIASIDVLTQRFFVPLELTIDANNKPVFKNYKNIYLESGDFGNIVYLPEENNRLSTDSVIATALASSAFPVAFGRIQLAVCEHNSEQTSSTCPQGFTATKVIYVDGGIFDNIPLSTARMLAEDEKDVNGKLKTLPYNKPLTYIYMSPGNLRFADQRIPADSESFTNKTSKEKLSYGIMDQMGFIDDTLNIGMGSELYSTLRSYDWNNVSPDETALQKRYQNPAQKTHPRKLLLTSRGALLTADYLSHFGAFAAREFREYDYYAGVYDGFYNAAKSICNGRIPTGDNNKTCITGIMLELHKKLELTSDKKAEYLFALLYQEEFCEANTLDALCYQSMPDNNNSLYVIQQAMKHSTSLDFRAFLQSLLPNKDAFHDASLHKMILADSMWYIDYAKSISDRMQKLEASSQSETGQSKLISLSGYIINSVDVTDTDFVWAISSAPTKNKWLYLVPDEIGFDVSQSGSVFTYRGKGDPWLAQIYPELEASLHIVSNVSSKNDYAHGGINFRRRVPSTFGLPISSVGLGYGFYKNFNENFSSLEWEGSETSERANINIGIFADKFRITYGQRLHGDERTRDSSRMVILSLTDIKGLLHWLF